MPKNAQKFQKSNYLFKKGLAANQNWYESIFFVFIEAAPLK